jgi:pimeloyl-ACP methyl ester carboxylesterase/DNA-binding CsgD family transcriptional regulator
MPQPVRFCQTVDGVRIAYAVTGAGPALVRAPHWLTHVEYDWQMPVRRHWIEELSRGYRFVRFDPRGSGLSDRDAPDVGVTGWVRDLEAVTQAAALDRYALLGPSQGGAVAIECAVRHPEQVSRLVLVGAFARGKLKRDPAQAEDAQAQLRLVELGWGSDDPAYRQLFANQMMPTGSPEAVASLCEMMRMSATPADATRMIRALYTIDVEASARAVRCPTLLMHSRGDRRVPHAEGRLLASLIPGARFVTLESINHLLPADDPAWPEFVARIREFVPSRDARTDLSHRELDVLNLLACGLDNTQIAERLGLSEKTVRNHLTRVFDKIGARHRSEAIVRAREAGYGALET